MERSIRGEEREGKDRGKERGRGSGEPEKRRSERVGR